MKITVKTLNNSVYTFDVEPSTTIATLKTLASPQIAIPHDKIRFIFRGIVLEDPNTVESYQLDDVTIHAVERLPPPPPSATETSEPGDFQPSLLRAIRDPSGTGNIYRDYPQHIIQRIIRRLQTSFGDYPLRSNSVETRIETASRFVEFFHTIWRQSQLTTNQLESIAQLQQTSNITADTRNITALASLLRRVSENMNNLQHVLNAYASLLVSSDQNSNDVAERQLWTTIPNTAALLLHTMSHAMHNVSDILAASTAIEGTSQQRLVLSTSNNISSFSSRPPAETTPNVNTSGNNAADTPLRRSTSITEQDGSEDFAYHLTVQFSGGSDQFQDVETQADVILLPNMSSAENMQQGSLDPDSTVYASSLNEVSRAQYEQQTVQHTSPGSNEGSFTIRDFLTRNPPPNDPFLNCDSTMASQNIMRPSQLVRVSNSRPSVNSTTTGSQPVPATRLATNPEDQPSPQTSIQGPPARAQHDEEAGEPIFVDTRMTVETPAEVVTSSTDTHDWSEMFSPNEAAAIRIDCEKHRSMRRQMPLSDAYIAGCPDAKRRFQDQENSLQYIMRPAAENLLEIVDNSGDVSVNVEALEEALQNNPGLQQNLQNAVDQSVRAAVGVYPEIDPIRYPKCANIKKKD